MSDESLLVGLDVGTSSAKAVLIDSSGEVLAVSAPEYDFQTPQPLWAESNPEDWYEASVQAIQEVLQAAGSRKIAGLGLTGQMHGLVLLDADGAVLRPCIIWNDQRTAEECRELTEAVGAARVLEITGNPILAGFTAPKIRWVEKNEPEVFSRIAHILLPKDYIRYRLTGVFATDVADASGTSLLDVGKRQWSEILCEACHVSGDWLPRLHESVEISAKISEKGASATGLAQGLPVAAGAGDQAAQAVGSGIIEEGVLSATFGTSGVVFAHSKNFKVEPEGRLHAFCSAVPGQWHLMGVMLSAAGSFQWFRNTLGDLEREREVAGGKDAYTQLIALAKDVPAGAEGLIFLPYLSGERTPHPDPLARGAFIGLTLRHKKGHLVRSVLEGITFGMRDSLELMRGLGVDPETVVISGGGVRSPLWRQMMADIFQARVATVNAAEGAAFGAALLGGVAGGVFPSVEAACRTTLRETGSEEPQASGDYDQAYQNYRGLYPCLKETFPKLG